MAAWCSVDFATIESNPLRFARNLYLNNELITKIVIPNGVTKIKKYAFYMCSATGLEFEGTGVSSIGEKAFDSSSLSGNIDININSSVGDSAFARCTGIENITFNGVQIGIADRKSVV